LFLGKQPITKDDIGIILLIPDEQYYFLINNQDGNEKLKYISSDIFINSVYASYFIIYNKKKRLCEIRYDIDNEKYLYDVLHSIINYLPSDITIWIGVIPIQNINIYINIGFDNPHICDKSPLDYKFNRKGIAFSKNNSVQKTDLFSVRNKVIYATKKHGNNCSIYARFTPESIKYLKEINNHKIQKEFSGTLKVSKVVKIDEKLIFELSPEPHNLITGEDEEVDAVWSRYNFHTHPKKAYENNGVIRGWPSSQDYLGFLALDNHTIFHTVVTLEGIYIISLSPEWVGKIKDIDNKYILKHYNINHKKLITFYQYVDKINTKTYKGKKLFLVHYLPWEKANNFFPVYYSKTKDKCLATEEEFKLYK